MYQTQNDNIIGQKRSVSVTLKIAFSILKVCGGGPSLSVWHLRSMACTSVLNTSSTQRAALFHDDLVSDKMEFIYVLGSSFTYELLSTLPENLKTSKYPSLYFVFLALDPLGWLRANCLSLADKR